jgi:SNF2 family DNA or RNA helicase
MNFIGVPSCYPQLIELRKSKTAEFKANKYLRPETKLRYYQVIGALHMMLLDRMVLGDGTGLGKTAISIGAYSFLLDKDPSLKLFVVCPKSAIFQWAEEFDKFTQGISVRVVTNEYKGQIGSIARQLHYQEFKENVIVMNYATLRNEYEAVKEILGSNFMAIFDEATEFKNRKTQTHMACKFVAESARRAYGLSATIIKNGLEEVYCIYDVIVPGLFGKITKFKDTYCHQKLMKIRVGGKDRYFPKIIGYKNLPQFKQVLDPYFLIRRKEEVASELPRLISKKIVLEMMPEQKDLYRKALSGILYEERTKQEYFEVMDKIRLGQVDDKTQERFKELKEKYDRFSTGEGKKRGKLAAITYCQMISNGPALVHEPGESSKEEEFVRLMTEELVTDKVILFTRFASGIPSLEVWCERKGIKYTRITGAENDRERQEARIKFQTDPTCNLIFITTAGAASLNLQAASCLIFYDTPWSYGDLVQTIGRAQRIGSLRDHVLILHLVNKGTVDVRVINRVTDKKDLSDEILGDTAQGALEFTANEDRVVDDLYTELLKDAEGLN